MKEQKPVLSIGIIFRDDIRSIERCLTALQPLREAIPCQLVMADTGSADGSRAVAERYADILFDFPWVNDFSAARNAVMDRCSGEWYLSVDTDEYLDENIAELLELLKGNKRKEYDACSIVVRNYKTSDMRGIYLDVYVVRLLRMSTGRRFEGAIHERLNFPEGRSVQGQSLTRTILHHDGYVGLNSPEGAKKRRRNLELLRRELEHAPEEPRRWLQLLESGREEEEYGAWVRQAVALVQAKKKGWQSYGPPIMSYAVEKAVDSGFPETEDWISWAREQFPDSLFTRIDIAYCDAFRCRGKDAQLCVQRCERYFQGLEDYRAGGVKEELMVAALTRTNPLHEQNMRIVMMEACLALGRWEETLAQLSALDCTRMSERHVLGACLTLFELHRNSTLDTAPVMEALWKGISEDQTKIARKKQSVLLSNGMKLFSREYRDQELWTKGIRSAYTVFLPLSGRYELGTAAAILESHDTGELNALLRAVEHWEYLPAAALEHALSAGVVFPLADKPLALEEMDVLAGRMAQEGLLEERVIRLAEHLPEDWQGLVWARELALAAVQSFDWKQDNRGMDLCRAFAGIEGAVLPRYYSEALLCEENIDVLPPLHRFGWYIAQAFQTQEAEKSPEYIRLIRAGLVSCPSMKPMAAFLLEQLERAQRLQAPPELLALAEQVRALLAACDPGDPAVTALKASPAYQKVAYLIEGIDGGGLPS
ncbi:glycosyltransferase [Colidextribacter sp. OB.20]|uniref:glycosyltransferase n=1 Tax=Colidextribacter sp. OB.20 TaxID=2304568 RepID=UPI001371E75F